MKRFLINKRVYLKLNYCSFLKIVSLKNSQNQQPFKKLHLEWLKSMHIKNDNLNITDFLHQAEKVEALISWKE